MRDPGQHLAAPVPLPQGELVLGQRFLEGIGSERQVSPSDSGVLDPPPTGPEEREGQQQQNQERGTDHDSREGRGESGGWLIPRRLRGEPPGASVIGEQPQHSHFTIHPCGWERCDLGRTEAVTLRVSTTIDERSTTRA